MPAVARKSGTDSISTGHGCDATTVTDQGSSDVFVNAIGAVRAGNFDGEGAWKEVMSTNFAKIDKETGKVRKREDGKVLKPIGWIPPDLKPYTKKDNK